MTIDEKRAREICNAASPAPWSVDPREYRDDGTQKYFPSLRLHESANGFDGRLTINVSKEQRMDEINATADFIAESRQMLPAALDEIQRLRAALLAACELAREAMGAFNPGKEPRNEYDLRLSLLLADTVTNEQIQDLMTKPSTTQELQALCKTALEPPSPRDEQIARARLAKIIHPRALGSALPW